MFYRSWTRAEKISYIQLEPLSFGWQILTLTEPKYQIQHIYGVQKLNI